MGVPHDAQADARPRVLAEGPGRLRGVGRDSGLKQTIEVGREVRHFKGLFLATSVRDHPQHPKHLVRLV
eukprot:8064799-Pyramimonas_sp.AAC.1